MISTQCRLSLSQVERFFVCGLCTLALSVLVLAIGSSAVADEPSAAVEQPPASQEEPKSDQPEEEATKKEAEKTQSVTVAEKRLVVTLPARWKQKERANNMIEAEFEVRKPEAKEENGQASDSAPVGRLTLSASGGGVEQNMRRWVGQFRLGHDADGKDAIRQEELKIEGAKVHLLDIAGTYFDAPRGPLGPKVERSDYRMLGAIVEIEDGGLYFVKFYGPKGIVEANAKDFRNAVENLKVKSAETSTDENENSDATRPAAPASPGVASNE